MQISQEKDVVDKLVALGTGHPLIRAMILTSSRTRPDGPVDELFDCRAAPQNSGLQS
jgi:hypothetical protein